MSSHRSASANFSSLKKLLPPLPAAANEDSPANPEPQIGEASPLLPQAPEPKNTARYPLSSYHSNTAAVQPAPSPTEKLPPQVTNRTGLSARPGKSTPITRPSTFRLPIELQDALKVVADYNHLKMTDIVAEGIWLHLQNFTWPDGCDELRVRIASLY